MTGYLDRPPVAHDRVRLFCFAHAGAGASAFASWRDALGPGVGVYPVQLPGRENRAGQRRRTDRGELLDELDTALSPYLDRPAVFYGHSLGGLLAFTLTQRLRERGPAALVVGAYPAPHLRPPLVETSHWSDDDLADELVRIGGMSPTVRRYPAWAASAVALLRDDLALLRGPVAQDRPAVPLHVVTGADDPLLSPTDADAWERWAGSTHTRHRLPGGHLFHHDSRDALLALVGDVVEAVAAQRAARSTTRPGTAATSSRV